jgi:predicted nucleic acid-binding protein
MNIVVDTSIIIAILSDEETKPAIIKATEDSNLISPASLPYEIVNAYTAMFKRRVCSLEEALDVIELFGTIPIRLIDVDLRQSINIAKALDIYAYDAYMIEVAFRYKAPLISLDKRLLEAAMKQGINVIQVR